MRISFQLLLLFLGNDEFSPENQKQFNCIIYELIKKKKRKSLTPSFYQLSLVHSSSQTSSLIHSNLFSAIRFQFSSVFSSILSTNIFVGLRMLLQDDLSRHCSIFCRCGIILRSGSILIHFKLASGFITSRNFIGLLTSSFLILGRLVVFSLQSFLGFVIQYELYCLLYL